MLTPDGRRVMIGWMQNWDTCQQRTTDVLWFGQMSLPRELSVKNGRLYQTPLRELEAFRSNKVVYRNVTFSDVTELEGIRGRRVNTVNGELKLRVILDRFSVEVFVNDGEQVLSAILYTGQSADGISFYADGTVNMDIVKYDLIV